jgi:hypothetical protein
MKTETHGLDGLGSTGSTLLFTVIVATTTWVGLAVFFGLVATLFIY